jgi:tetratricopeptide (TPR) repeat protein
MGINFSNLSIPKTSKQRADPIKLFQSLKVNDSSINDLWLAQGDALREWHSKRTDDDVAIVLNTGAGKTLVGLLAAQSIVNEINDHVLYVCSSIQLVEQTAAKAKGYGLDVTTYFRSDFSNSLYQQCLAPCITTYQAVFNGKSRFLKEIPKAIIFDDAHTAEHLLRDYFTLRIKRKSCPSLFSQITTLFQSYFDKIGRGVGYLEILKQQNYRQYFIPPFALYEQHNELERFLLDGKLNDNMETMFSWEYLKDHIDQCTIFVSGREITITPPVVPVGQIPYFQAGVRRLYLSATLAAGDKFVRTFGKVPEIIAPKTTAGECERLIIIPSLNKKCKKDTDVAKRIIHDKKALILVPSYQRKEVWKDVLTKQEEDNVTEQIEKFKQSNSPDKLLLVSRYDGVDLPGDICRVMVIDKLPSSLNPLEIYFWEQLSLVKSLRSAIASRVVQGFGRISRGMSDYGVVVITDKKLIDWLLEPKNQAALPPFLRQQIKLGIGLSEQVDSLDDLIDSASQCLTRDPNWISYYQQFMEQSDSSKEATTDEEALNIAKVEVEFGNYLWQRDYQKAAKSLEKSLQETFKVSDNTGAWHLLWLGYCYERMGKIEEAYEAYQQAHNIETNIPPLHTQDLSDKDRQLPFQVLEVARYLYPSSPQMSGKIPKRFDPDLALLDGTGTPAQTEEALRALGRYLGLKASRPDKEFSTGPDVLWEISDGSALSLEVKTDKKENSSYTKEDLGQLRDHAQWVRDNSESSVIHSAFVGLLLSPSSSANPDFETMVIELSEFKAIAERLRAALEDICTKALPVTLPQAIFDIFQERNLLWCDLYEQINKSRLRNLG